MGSPALRGKCSLQALPRRVPRVHEAHQSLADWRHFLSRSCCQREHVPQPASAESKCPAWEMVAPEVHTRTDVHPYSYGRQMCPTLERSATLYHLLGTCGIPITQFAASLHQRCSHVQTSARCPPHPKNDGKERAFQQRLRLCVGEVQHALLHFSKSQWTMQRSASPRPLVPCRGYQ